LTSQLWLIYFFSGSTGYIRVL